MTTNELIAMAGRAFGASFAGMTGHSHKPNVIRARAAAAIALYERGLSFSRIGRRMNRDHTTIRYHWINRAKWLADPDIAAVVEHLKGVSMDDPIAVNLDRFDPDKPRTPRQMYAAGELDGEELRHAEHMAAMAKGSRMLADCINAQFAA